ncbi:hypothetical protein [[Eubacterium] cellulosolvens]
MPVNKDRKINALNKKIINSFEHVENRFEKVLDEIQETLEDMVSDSKKFIDSGDPFAEQFGKKVTTLISELKRPDKIGFQEIKSYLNALETFHRKIIYYGVRWLRKISSEHKFSIKQIEWKRKQVLNLTKDLNVLFSKYKDELEKWKKAESIVRRLSKLEEERFANKKVLEKVENKMKQLKNLIEGENQRIKALGQKEDLVKAKEFKKNKALFEQQVKTELRHLEKPVLKSIKLIDDKSIVKDQHKIIRLERFVRDPSKVLLELKDVKTVKEALIYLQELLRSKRLNLKRSRNKKGLDSISNILKENRLENYKKKFEEYAEQKSQLDAEGVIEKTSEFEDIKTEFQKKNELLDNAINEKKRIEENINSCDEKIKDCRTKLEELI